MKLSGREVEPKVLLVSEVKEVLDHIKEQSLSVGSQLDLHVVDLLFDNEFPAVAVAKSTGFTMEELEGPLDPNELDAVIKEARVKNPFFVGMMERLVAAGRGGSGRTDRQPSSTESAS